MVCLTQSRATPCSSQLPASQPKIVGGNPATSENTGFYAVAVPQIAGRYYAHVTMQGEELGASPLSLHVRPAPALALVCEALGDGLQHADAGVPAFCDPHPGVA